MEEKGKEFPDYPRIMLEWKLHIFKKKKNQNENNSADIENSFEGGSRDIIIVDEF